MGYKAADSIICCSHVILYFPFNKPDVYYVLQSSAVILVVIYLNFL